MDRVQRDFLINKITQLDIHIAEKHGDVDVFYLGYALLFILKLLKN